jgi:hypothetical protein
VINKRHELKIPSYARESKFWHTWTKREIAMLGKMTDRELGDRIGIRPMCVTSKRRLLKVPAFIQHKKRRPPRRLENWGNEDLDLLGKMTDPEVAKRLDVSTATVRLKRISLCIAPYRRGKTEEAGIWTRKVVVRLGKESNTAIARDLGVSAERVRQKCQELGIPPFAARRRRV